MPYVGLKFAGRSGPWQFDAGYIYSNAVEVSASDHHHLRDLIFEDDFARGEMSAAELELGYRIGQDVSLLAGHAVQDYPEVRGDTLYRNATSGAITGYCSNCAGADNQSPRWSIGLGYRF